MVGPELPPGSYQIEQHSHRFAAWAASRAASVKGCRFSVEQGRTILEGCGFRDQFSKPDELPTPPTIDTRHREWRERACEIAKALGVQFTHGVAAKLINCYLKSRFVCAGHHLHENVAALHPPIDKVLLEELAKRDFAGRSKEWKRASQQGWSKLSSEEYQELIGLIKKHLLGKPLWTIEEFWRGNQ